MGKKGKEIENAAPAKKNQSIKSCLKDPPEAFDAVVNNNDLKPSVQTESQF
jgi:hypothetical protein